LLSRPNFLNVSGEHLRDQTAVLYRRDTQKPAAPGCGLNTGGGVGFVVIDGANRAVGSTASNASIADRQMEPARSQIKLLAGDCGVCLEVAPFHLGSRPRGNGRRHGPIAINGERCKSPRSWPPLLLLPVAASSNSGTRNSVHRPRRGASSCRFFLQNVLILSPERPARPGASCRPRLITSSGTSKEND
jgi:hypothetical protein